MSSPAKNDFMLVTASSGGVWSSRRRECFERIDLFVCFTTRAGPQEVARIARSQASQREQKRVMMEKLRGLFDLCISQGCLYHYNRQVGANVNKAIHPLPFHIDVDTPKAEECMHHCSGAPPPANSLIRSLNKRLSPSLEYYCWQDGGSFGLAGFPSVHDRFASNISTIYRALVANVPRNGRLCPGVLVFRPLPCKCFSSGVCIDAPPEHQGSKLSLIFLYPRTRRITTTSTYSSSRTWCLYSVSSRGFGISKSIARSLCMVSSPAAAGRL